MKKLCSFILFTILIFSLSACGEKITITSNLADSYEIILTEGDTFDASTLSITTNDELGFEYQSSNDTVFTVNTSSGLITAVGEGIGSLKIESKTDSDAFIEIDVTIRKLVVITPEVTEVTVTAGDEYTLNVTTNDTVVFTSSNLDVFVVDEDGVITAKTEGTASLSITSTYDPTIFQTVTVIVQKVVELTATNSEYVMVVGDHKSVVYESNDDVTFESRNPNIVNVSSTGQMTALQFGTATIRIISTTDPLIMVEVAVTVFKVTTAIVIEGNNLLIVGMNGQLSISPSPVGGYEEVTWDSLDDSIVSVDENGQLTAGSVGTTSITATSVLDTNIVDTFDVEAINASVVDATATTGSTYTYMGVELVYGERLYSDLTSALAASPEGTFIFIDNGTFDEDVTISQGGITVEGTSAVSFTGVMTIAADDVTIRNLNFTEDAQILNTGDIERFVFTGNTVANSTLSSGAFLEISGVSSIEVTNNTFDTMTVNAVMISDFIAGRIEVSNNMFSDVEKAIVITATREYDITTEIQVWWNDIDTVDTAIDINLLYGTEQKTIEAIVRFNTITNATLGAVSNLGNTIDFTLNFWGCVELDMGKFTNIDPYYLRGFYTVEEQVLTATSYNPSYPVLIIILNPIDEIMIGDTHTFTYELLPMEMSDHPMKFITGNADILAINQSGEITPLKSGEVTVTLRSSMNSSIKTTTSFAIVTTPGIELIPSNVMNDVVVGDSFTLRAEPFPKSYENEAVTFSSSDETIATIDVFGNVTTLQEGLVTFSAALVSDPLVTQEFTTYVYDALDPTNLLDYLTMKQVHYTTSHEWIAYGFMFNYNDRRYESVSRYYFDNIVINDSKIVDVFYAIRPGAPMDPLPDGLPQYNPENVYWVVVHDTASTAPGSNALAHANYLYNSTVNKTELWVSWHFTIDDTNVYQHLPTDERGFHAGDGSTNPGEGSYLGGGNRNGIGIEMAVNQDGDMMRTWQRTAKLATELLLEYNLPLDHQKFHNDFSGKDCPNTLRNAGLVPLFHEFMEVEYNVATEFPGAQIIFHSNNPEFLDDHGRIIAMPERAMTVSYTITVTFAGETQSRTFYSYLPGTVR